ncbi:Mediator of RNA polymerase II transcription subunit 31 [Zostera marina]|uniref:Mediator of RNA polymerase II transcription subunit 31 n=1 Tax=Zostera marina TaxID=29655 RepID=A0A0K9P387_ZOSMR|nr:Mediator of RNA polymerase II transcription subunit 31 [Zostera marina]
MISESPEAFETFKDPDDGRQRLLIELEFVQCLANPIYIHHLAQNQYFEDEAFVRYLKYLQYWQKPQYITLIMYPHCLYFLELLQNESFRSAMAHPSYKELVHQQQFYFWKHHKKNRLNYILTSYHSESAPKPSVVPPSPAPPETVPAESTPAESVPAESIPAESVPRPSHSLMQMQMQMPELIDLTDIGDEEMS